MTNLKSKRRELLVFGFAMLLLGLLLLLISELGTGLDQFDRSLLDSLRAMRTSFLNRFFLELTALGSATVLTLLSLTVIALLALERRYRLALQLALAGVLSSLTTSLLKAHFARARPPLDGRIDIVTGFSFPSGHSSSGASIYLTLALLALPFFSSEKMRQLFLVGTGLFVVLLGFSRMYLGVHYPSDVIAGLSLGTGIACLLHLFLHTRSGWHLRWNFKRAKAGKVPARSPKGLRKESGTRRAL